MPKVKKDPVVVVSSKCNPSLEEIEAAISSGKELSFVLAKSVAPNRWRRGVMLRITSVDDAPRPDVVLVYGYYSLPGNERVDVEIVYDHLARTGALIFL